MKKVDAFDIYMKLICLLPISTLFQSYIESINKIIILIVFILQIAIITKNKLNKKIFVLLMISLVNYLFTLFNTENLVFSNAIIYFINWMIYVVFVIQNKVRFTEWFIQNKKYLSVIITIWSTLVFISIFLPSSYYDKEAGASYFSSFTGSIFRLAPTALFVMSLALILITVFEDRKAILFCLIPLYCGAMGSSRTYFVIILLVFLMCVMSWCKTKKQFLLMLLPIIIGVVVLYFHSSLSLKVQYTLNANQYGDFWYRITSSRSVIWSKVLSAFEKSSLYNKFTGNGFGFSNRVAWHYSHNDFIEILATHGYIGVTLYFLSIVYLIKEMLPRDLKVKLGVYLIIFLVWIINAFFNMFYWYTCSALSFPILLVAAICGSHFKKRMDLTVDDD